MADVLRRAIGAQTAPAPTPAPSQSPGGDTAPAPAASSSGRTTALELLTIDATQGQPIRSGVLSGARIEADPRANALIVTAPAGSMELIAALIEELDRAPTVQAEIKVFTLTSGDAVSLADTLRQLFALPTEGDGDGAPPGGTENALVGLRLSVDERTNSIIAAGSRDDLVVVEAILLKLDEGDVRERVTTVYRLKNAYAVEVATALNEWLQTERQVEQEAELAVSPFEQIEREVIIVPEIGSNSLIVSATPRYYDELRDLIDDLDERPPMVMIQVLIAEVRLNDTDEFGVEFGLQDPLLFDRSLLQIDDFQTITTTSQTQSAGGATISTVTEETIVNAPLNPGFNFNNQPLGNNGSATALANAGAVAAQGLSHFAVGRVGELGFGGLVLSASSDAVNMLLRALQEKRRLEVLSRPQIMTLDGKPGEVLVGELVPQILGVAITDFGQQNTVDYREVGLILRVIPRISPDGLVVMDVQVQKSQVGPIAEGIPVSIVNGQPVNAPRIATTQALTTVSALSGQTIVLSGLLTKRTQDLHRRVPLIADIPLIGNLFRFDSVAQERTELLIILTPQIVNNRMDAELIKQVESARMSWVLCDVINMHGEAGLRSRCDEWGASESESVYPTYVPQEGELVPAGEPAPVLNGPHLELPARLPAL
jgi:type II secretion system protein D